MKLFLAGAENGYAQKVFKAIGIPHILMSYYYVRGKKKENIIRMIEEYRASGVKIIMLDSGAHSFFAEEGIGAGTVDKKIKTKESTDEYYEKYREWLKTFSQYFDIIVELDIGALVGLEKVERWRKELIDIIGKEKLMVGFHSLYMDRDYFRLLCKEFNYVGIGMGRKEKLGEWNSLLNIAQKYKTKVHGFAMTKLEFMTKLPLFSVDSTSWNTGSKYGIMYAFQNNKLKSLGKEEKRRYRSYFESNNLDWEKIKNEDIIEIGKASVLAWLKYEQFVEKHSKKYWEESTSEIKKVSPVFPCPETKGNIQEIMKDPEVQKKWKEKMKNNLFAFKNGKYSMKVPLYCNNCYAKDRCEFYQAPQKEGQNILCALRDEFSKWFKAEDFDIRDEEVVSEVKNRMMSVMLQRLGLQFWFEFLDGGIQDKSATALASIILDKLTNKAPLIQQNNLEININKKIANNINNLDDETRKKLISAIREASNKQEYKSE